MKKFFVLLVSCYLLALSTVEGFAQEEVSPTPRVKKTAPTEVPTPKSRVDELKEKVANTVAQLNLVSKRAFVGEVTKLERTQLSIEKNGDVQIVEVDELTKYVSVGKDGKKAEIAFKDLDVGNQIVAIGLYNKESEKLLGRIILVKELMVNVNGVVREVDIKGGTITVEDRKRNVTFTVDVEKTTVIRKYTKTEGLVKAGLSRIEIGERAHINGAQDAQEKSRLSANRILSLPGKAVGIVSPPAVKKEATPASQQTTPTPRPGRKPTPTPTE